ncbi:MULTISPECIES: hypothetical protein [Prauserella]|uniref:Secreted protein/lipoprotein n=1 Tax=Prauserella endophytica TaxID=1592324 RepID=A0ABY2RWL8_9PSEU|nr:MULTISPECIES: hypothetical protein [Prauserella]TKG63574.1 hypothetical protein FCN18_30215 [Prauserella endophytica]
MAVALGASLLVSGCSGERPSAPPPLDSSAPSQGSLAPSASLDAAAAVEAAYTQFWPRSAQTPHKPEDTWRDAIAAIAIEPQLSVTLEAMRRNKAAGFTTYGEVVVRITSVEVSGDTAKVVDCQDASRAGQADARTGDPKTVGVPRMPVTATMKRDQASGQWKVARLRFPGGAC